MIIRNLKLLNLNDIVNLHQNNFKNFFLSNLGGDFLYIYYKELLISNKDLSIGYFDKDDSLKGFAIGTTDSKTLYIRIIKNNILQFSFIIMKKCLFKPFLLLSLASKYINNTKNFQKEGAFLISLVVDKSIRKKGLGKELIKKFESICAKNHNLIQLTTDTDNNEYVNKFYLKNGYKLVLTFSQTKNRKMNLYEKIPY